MAESIKALLALQLVKLPVFGVFWVISLDGVPVGHWHRPMQEATAAAVESWLRPTGT